MSDFDKMEQSLKLLSARWSFLPLKELTLLRLIDHYGDFIAQQLRQLVRPYGLTDWSLRALLMMQGGENGKGVSMAMLSLATGETSTNMTRVCDELVKSGLATRADDAKDRRKVLLSATPKAEEILSQALPKVWSHLATSMSVLSEDELVLLIGLLKKLTIGAEIEAEKLLQSRNESTVSHEAAIATPTQRAKRKIK